ncbi:MAG: hypothetical protein FJW31_15085 [Acidobacteria bacterium]|nr:hypothetical protein [Acidobacteriota bacterium]
MAQAVEAAWKAGIVVVVAAGNEGRNNSFGNQGYGTIHSPGNHPSVITVGAMRTLGTVSRADDMVATFSSKGPTAVDHIVKPDLVAPGNLITTVAPHKKATLAKSLPDNFVDRSVYQIGVQASKSTDYFTLSGTSLATPVVSGAAALLLQREPGLTPDQVKARLMKTASKIHRANAPAAGFTAVHDLFTVGAGYLNIEAALNNRDLPVGLAVSPRTMFDAATQTVRLVSDSTVI